MMTVAEFESELAKRAQPRYAQWRRIDLHNHTPASFDYRYAGADLAERLAEQILKNDLAVTMFTDHERLPDAALTDQLSKRTGRLVLRGVEMNVFVNFFDKAEGKVSNDAFYHLLIGFDPNGRHSPEYWLEELYRKGGETARDRGDGRSIRGVTASPEHLRELLSDANAIMIPAHLHTTRDISKTRSVDDIYADDVFLGHARTAFTALEVTSPKTAEFFDGRHHETGLLAKGCMRSSDSHEPASLGWRPSYAQLEKLTYTELKAALELPFRLAIDQPTLPEAHIIGISVTGAFLKDLWISFSPHCNMLIAVKGSGKTSVLECLRFALGAEVPKSRLDTVNQHLNAILGPAGEVRVLLRRPDGAKVLVQRSQADKGFTLVFEDGRREQLQSADGLLFPSQILGWHEIEQAATDVNIRRVYMDTIAGRARIKTLEEEATATASRIRDRHTYASQRYVVFRDIQRQAERLRELRSGLQQLTDAALIDLRSRYQLASDQREAVVGVIDRLERVAADPLNMSSVVPAADTLPTGDSPLKTSVENVAAVLEGVRSTLDSAEAGLKEHVSTAVARLRECQIGVDATYSAFLEDYKQRVGGLSPEQQRLLETHREVLEQTKGLTGLEAELAVVKQELTELLHELTSHCDRLSSLLDERTRLRREAVDRLNSLLSPYGVRVTLLAQQASGDLSELSGRYSNGSRALAELRSKLPDRLAHLCLRKAYGGMYSSLDVDYAPLLFDSEMSYFLSSFENDDLRIELKAGKKGQEFSPIDQLSAGQRCTAMFPMLLSLDQGPLLIDQPEDNLDNRYIAQSIAPALLHDKRRRQMIFTSHNANLVVLSDAESVCLFESDGSVGRLEQQGFFSTKESSIAKHVLDVLDGGERALQLRALKYGLDRS